MLIPQGILRFIATYYLNNTFVVDRVLNIIFQSLASLALIVAISNANLQREFTIKTAYSQSIKRFWSLIGATILKGLAIILFILPMGFCYNLITLVGSSGYSRFFGIILFLPLIIFIGTRWLLSSAVIILEKVGAMDSLSRSWELTRDFFWRVLGTSFLANLLSLLLTILPYFFVNPVFKIIGASPREMALVSIVIEQISTVIILPFTIAVNVLIYYDLRIRKEGFDLMIQAGGA